MHLSLCFPVLPCHDESNAIHQLWRISRLAGLSGDRRFYSGLLPGGIFCASGIRSGRGVFRFKTRMFAGQAFGGADRVELRLRRSAHIYCRRVGVGRNGAVFQLPGRRVFYFAMALPAFGISISGLSGGISVEKDLRIFAGCAVRDHIQPPERQLPFHVLECGQDDCCLQPAVTSEAADFRGGHRLRRTPR
ncbi:large Ala/Gln-rich protein [Thermoanaerobacterium thermosaccharolyticum]|uniref:Large Ala/Gln-rich protein n=1 Tax=Thermoanaerobacterium thermosaccharolyticum TaxID=1517 RepID=A0A223I0T4_THETR|nr:large Ala/Gln-rich protein [Thermoanaerobacterium thermosaccharolyticum]